MCTLSFAFLLGSFFSFLLKLFFSFLTTFRSFSDSNWMMKKSLEEWSSPTDWVSINLMEALCESFFALSVCVSLCTRFYRSHDQSNEARAPMEHLILWIVVSKISMTLPLKFIPALHSHDTISLLSSLLPTRWIFHWNTHMHGAQCILIVMKIH